METDLGVHFPQTLTIISKSNYSLPTSALYCVVVVFTLLGLVGNVLLYKMTRHPDLKGVSCRVYLSFLAVVDTVDVLKTLTFVVADHFELTEFSLSSDVSMCKLVNGLISWISDMPVFGLAGLALDRYSAFVVTRFKGTICTCTNARLVCLAFVVFSGFIVMPYSTTFHLVNDGVSTICYKEHGSLYFVITLTTGLLLCFIVLYMTLHTLWVFSRRPEPVQNSLEAADTNDRETLVGVVAVAIVSALIRLPLAIFEPLSGACYHILTSDQVEQWPMQVVRSKTILLTGTCLSLICKLYVLIASDPFFRRCVSETITRCTCRSEQDTEDIELPGDHRVLTAVSETHAMEMTTGQIVDLHKFNKQREQNQLCKQQSSSDSISSALSSGTTIDDDHRCGSVHRHQNSHGSYKHCHRAPLKCFGERKDLDGENEDDSEKSDRELRRVADINEVHRAGVNDTSEVQVQVNINHTTIMDSNQEQSDGDDAQVMDITQVQDTSNTMATDNTDGQQQLQPHIPSSASREAQQDSAGQAKENPVGNLPNPYYDPEDRRYTSRNKLESDSTSEDKTEGNTPGEETDADSETKKMTGVVAE